MTLSGILSSPSQRRTFLLASIAVLLLFTIALFAIFYWSPNTRIWNALGSLVTSVVAAGVFALFSGFYITYFFVDPNDLAAQSTLLPEDIGQALKTIAASAAEYKIFVRTGRHFRAEILPMLVKRACENRQLIRIEVILLDFRNEGICEKYANYRKRSSFDRQLWTTTYVQKEVLATIIALSEQSNLNREMINVNLFLTKRLSTFRIEGSSDEILVTREDPKDTAYRYSRNHPNFGAFVTEFNWIRDEAYQVAQRQAGPLPATLQAMFGENAEIAKLEDAAEQASKAPSPYVR